MNELNTLKCNLKMAKMVNVMFVYFTTIENTQVITGKKIDCGDNYTTLNVLMYLKCEYTNCTFLNGYIM